MLLAACINARSEVGATAPRACGAAGKSSLARHFFLFFRAQAGGACPQRESSVFPEGGQLVPPNSRPALASMAGR